MGNANVKTGKFQTSGVNDTSEMLDRCKVGNKYPSVGPKNEPHIFLDEKGMLHIVLYGKEEADQIELHMNAIQGASPNNEGKGCTDGIYIHESLSPVTDKVCPCKLNPNGSCE